MFIITPAAISFSLFRLKMQRAKHLLPTYTRAATTKVFCQLLVSHVVLNNLVYGVDRTYSISFNSSNDGEFFWILNSKGLSRRSGIEKQSRCLLFTSATKRESRHLHVVVVKWTSKTYINKCDAHAKLLFCQS